jgi:HAMP domain-containing protein
MLPRFLALTLALFFGAAGAALFLSRGLARRVTAPVDRLSRAMQDVAASGRFTPVSESPGDDDLFRSLARSFNHLLAKLDANDRELRRTMTALVAARDQANTANIAKSQFLANMSHEIRTPLNGVLAMADIMSRGELDARQRERLGVIRESGELLLSVLNDVLDLSKIEAGKLELEIGDFELGAREGAGAPGDGLEPCQQLFEGERLGHIIIGTGAERSDFRIHGVLRGEHEDGPVHAAAAQSAFASSSSSFSTSSASSSATASAASSVDSRPTVCIVIGMAGAGKLDREPVPEFFHRTAADGRNGEEGSLQDGDAQRGQGAG